MEERTKGIEEINTLRRRVAEEEARKKAQQKEGGNEAGERREEEAARRETTDADTEMAPAPDVNGSAGAAREGDAGADRQAEEKAEGMDVDDGKTGDSATQGEKPQEKEAKKPTEAAAAAQIPTRADEDDAVEY